MTDQVIYAALAEHFDDPKCTCPACTNVSDPSDASLDPRAGGTANNKPIWTPEQAAAYLNRTGGGFADGFNDGANVGRQNNIGDDGSVITFGFFNTLEQVYNNGYTYTANNAQGVPTLYGLAEAFNFAPFTEAQRAAAREAFQYWDDVVAVSFREASADDADMNLANLASAPTTQAYARIPTAGLDATLGGQVREIGGDSWYSASQASNFQLDEGLYGMNTLTHEIGHGIGLSHPGAYNFGPGFAVTYANGAEYAQDARNYSIMSYWNPRDLGTAGGDTATRDFDWSLMSIAYGATPMVHDILAAQRIYGADMTTRTGDNTYGHNASGDDMRDAFDFDKTPWPTMAIWDAGGIDTLDASKYNVDQVIDLTPGSLSSIGGVTYAEALEKLTFEQVNANRAAAGYAPVALATYNANMAALAADPNFRGRLTDNVGIAYGTIIENAKGGAGNDVLVGNEAANRLDGGAGFDVVSYRSAAVGVEAKLGSNGTGDGSKGNAAGDRYTNVEGLEGSNFDDKLTGGNGKDTLRGLDGVDLIEGGNADDTIDGGAGNDRLTGGNGADTILGGDGDDNIDAGNENDTVDGGAGNDRVDAGNGNDTLGGGTGDDQLYAGNGNDTLNGGDGADRLFGDNGNDVIAGGAGDDRLSGGNGSDKFVFANDGSVDTILDFRSGSDKIDLSSLGIDSGDVLFEGGKLFVDATGDGVFDFNVVVQGDAVKPADILFG